MTKKKAKRQNLYHVVWEIDVQAANPQAAAAMARSCQEPGTLATCFDVYDLKGNKTRVDLGVVD